MSRAVCGLTAQLLQYPGEAFVAALPDLAAAVAALPAGPANRALTAFVAHCRAAVPEALAEDYVQTFDFSPALTLHLTAHTFGQEKDRSVAPQRGFALTQLADVYAAAGVAPDGGELPDFLPALLEFVSGHGCPPALARFVPALLRSIERLRAGLAEKGSPYAPVMACAGTALAAVQRSEGHRR